MSWLSDLPLLYVVIASAVILMVAYVIYGRILGRLFALNPDRPTPAQEMRDGVDYDPLAPSSLVPQHFSAIAAAGPIVGPILAGITFGWLPALIWILVGSILVGGVHDFSALVASIRHKARSIAEVVRDNMSQRSYLLFLSFIWIALVYIIVAFTDVTAGAFVSRPTPESPAGGGAVATSSILYLGLTLLMGLALKFRKSPAAWIPAVFVVLVGGAIVAGPYLPLDLGKLTGLSAGNDRKLWDAILLVYCLVAGVVPVWLLLQPRGQLGGYFLYAALGAGAIGLAFGGLSSKYPAVTAPVLSGERSIFPLLFIMIACGACSGFHSLIASGTTSKQLRKETDAKVVGYGTMLMEAMVAVVSLSCVMVFAQGSPELDPNQPNLVYAHGIGKFLEVVRIVPPAVGMSFALMAFTTFVYDTLDVCTRLGRFIIQELTGLHNSTGRWLGTALTAGVPLYFLLQQPVGPGTEPVWKVFWNLFGASNQLLAALTLLGVTVWLWRTRRAWWVWIVTGLPTAWMYVMSTWALVTMTLPKFYQAGQWKLTGDVVAWAGVVLIALAALMLMEAIRIIASVGGPPRAEPGMSLAGGTIATGSGSAGGA
jgi:carbon starvation protein